MDNNEPMKLSQLLNILSEGENEARQLSSHSNYEQFQTAVMNLQSRFSQAIVIASSMEEAAGLRQMQTGSGSPGRSRSGSPRSDASERTSRKRKDTVKRRIKVPCTTPNSGPSDAALPPEDGFSWRKYGQKNILNSKNPRSYYRCTYQKTQNCPAIKQVQRSDEDPTFCDVTYQGDHTCGHACGQTSLTQSLERQLLIAPQTDSTDHHQLMINFHHESYPDEQQGTTILSPPSTSSTANVFATPGTNFGGQFSGASTDQSNYYYSAYQSQNEFGADFGGLSGNFHGSAEFGFGSDVFADDQNEYLFNASHPFK